MAENEKEVLSLEEASQLFQVSSKTFLKLLREENIPARKIGREWRFSRTALLDWMAQGSSRDYVSVEEEGKVYFAQVAPVYDEMRKNCYVEALRDILALRFAPPKDSVVADIGTGTGYLAKKLAEYAKTVNAIDSSPAMLEAARQGLTEKELKKIKLIEGDAHDLPLPDESQDLVYANLLVHHLLEPALAIKEMHRVLKPGGKVIISDIDRHNHKWTKSEKSDLWLGIERSDLRGWLKEAGFSGPEVTDLGCTCRVSSATGVTVEIPMFLAIGDKS
jgi:excisionase family DNA binding protein